MELVVSGTDGADGTSPPGVAGALVDPFTSLEARSFGWSGPPSSSSPAHETPNSQKSQKTAVTQESPTAAAAAPSSLQQPEHPEQPQESSQVVAAVAESVVPVECSSAESVFEESDSLDVDLFLDSFSSFDFFERFRRGELLLTCEFTDTNVMDILVLVLKPLSK